MGCAASKPASHGSISASLGFDGMDFPMWVLPVSALLEMKGPAKHHQNLLKSGLLVQWRPGMSRGSMASPIIPALRAASLVTSRTVRSPQYQSPELPPTAEIYQSCWELQFASPQFLRGVRCLEVHAVRLVAFVSHQWLGSVHPDPMGKQLAVLQAFIKNLATKQITLGLKSQVD